MSSRTLQQRWKASFPSSDDIAVVVSNHSGALRIIAAALLIRYSLMWFNHIWDITTFHNMFINLATGVNPYDEFVRLTHERRSSVQFWSRWHAYYAYPPGLIYLYTPLAKIWATLIGDIPSTRYISSGLTYPPRGVLNPVFLVLFKTPIFAADVGIGVLLYKYAGVRAMKRYLFNPLVILVSAMWMFDAIPLFFLLAGVYCVYHDRPVVAGAMIGVGAVFKFFPAFVAPAIVLYYLKRRSWSCFTFGASFSITMFGLIAPYFTDMLPTLEYHGSRVGGGMTAHVLITVYSAFTNGDILWIQTELSPTVGSLTLIAGLTLIYVWGYRNELGLNSIVIITLSGFFLATKLVNEQYGMWIIPFLIIALESHSTSLREILYKCTYMLPIAYAVVNVPLVSFLYPLGFIIDDIGIVGMEVSYDVRSVFLTLFAFAFMITMLANIREYATTDETIQEVDNA